MQPPTQTAAPDDAALGPGPSHVEFFLAALIIAVMALMAYSNTFRVPFYFDDRQGITDNRTIDMLWPLWRPLDAPTAVNSGAVGRPLVNFSLAVNYEISQDLTASRDGLDPASYHIFNLIVHVLTAWLLLAVLWRTLRRPPLAQRFGAAAFPLAFVIALLWAVHPLLTETVTNAIQRNESMVSLFYLLVIYCFIRSAGSLRPWMWQAGAVVVCFMGVATKEVMFSAPLMVLLYDRTFVAGSFLQALARRWAFYLSMCLSWGLLGYLVHHASKRGGTVGFGLGMTVHDYVLKQCEAVIHYFQLAFWPHPLVLDYGEDVVKNLSSVWPQALLLTLLVGGTLVALWRNPALGFAGAWVFIILGPSSSFLPLTTQTEAEHRMYLPLAAILALAILGVYTWIGRRIYVIAGALTLALAAATFARNHDYRTEAAQWEQNVAERPHNYRAHYDFGCALLNLGRYVDASSEFILTLKYNPNYPEGHCNLGACLENLGDEPSAKAEYDAAVLLNSNDVQSNYNLGCIYWNREDLPAAVEHFRISADNDPTYADAYANLGKVLVLSNRSLDALAPLKTALDLEPHNTDTLAYFGQALQAQGLTKNAIAIFQKALALKPDSADLHKKLGGAFADDDRLDRALEEDAAAVRLSPDDPESHYFYGQHLSELGQFDEAVAEFTQATKLQPEYPEAENELGNALMGLNRTADAKAAYNRALTQKPDFAEAHYNLGNAFLADNQPAEAEEQFRLALKTNPDYAEVHNDLGNVLMMQNRYNDAAIEYQEALRIDPDYTDAQDNYDALQAFLGGN